MDFKIKVASNTIKIASVPDHCPNCNKPTTPNLVGNGCHPRNDGQFGVFLTLRCPGCQHYWTEEFLDDFLNGNTLIHQQVIPELPSDIPLSDNIEKISAIGKQIYTQSLKAEQEKLDHIAGIGYRKALEFFVKDFAVTFSPKDEDKISKMPLKQVITEYVDDENLKTFALATTYLGNDETHYIRKHNDKDLKDLKKFLHGFLYYLEMKLNFLDAQDFLNH